MRTLGQAVAETGLRVSSLVLYPYQIALLNNSSLPRLFLWGPPGTGKTVVLTLKATQWLKQGRDVHLVGVCHEGRAVVTLIEQQLSIMTLGTALGTAPRATGKVHRHWFDFWGSPGEVTPAVEKLAAMSRGGLLFLIVDEVKEFVGSVIY